jgi:hypothetical protein
MESLKLNLSYSTYSKCRILRDLYSTAIDAFEDANNFKVPVG